VRNRWKIRPILTGYNSVDKGLYVTHQTDVGVEMELPVLAFLIEGYDRRILVDTGMSSGEHATRWHHDGRQKPEQAIHKALELMDVPTDSIGTIIITHMHWDHTFNLDKFPQARKVVHQKEWEFAQNPIPVYWKSYESPALGIGKPRPFDGVKFDKVAGEEEIVEGIRVFPTPGHSPGHQSVQVRTQQGVVVLAGDGFFTKDNLAPDPKRGWPLMPAGRFANVVELWHSMEEMKERADLILMAHEASHLEQEVYG
jgi:glyoxylase-like metal-dependent hydrolase (beta-lactamase superfamily II)